jgi:hypothetical protein
VRGVTDWAAGVTRGFPGKEADLAGADIFATSVSAHRHSQHINKAEVRQEGKG